MSPGAVLLGGDARALPLRDESVQCVVTSPPYWGLRDYGVVGQVGLEGTPEGYVAALVACFREVRRVLRDDGTCWVNLGDSYTTFPAGNKAGPDGYKASTLTNPWRMEQIRIRQPERSWGGLKPKDLVGIPWRVAFALQADGWWLRADVIWAKPNPMPESVTDRPTKAHEYLFLLTKRATYYYDGEAIKEPSVWPDGPNAPEAIKSPYGQGFTRRSRGKQADVHGQTVHGGDRWNGFKDGAPTRNRRSVWTIATAPYPEAHFATFPEALVEPCVLAGSRPGDRVLDPFAGSGTTVAVAERLGRVGIGVELKPAYLRLARQRTVQAGLL